MKTTVLATDRVFANTASDDQILPMTRWLARLIVPVLVLGFVLLYIWPDNTEELFAWTIRPRMTPLLMGAGYLGGAYFFLRAALATKWHYIAVGFLPVATFASFMTVATLLHWENFNHTHPAFSSGRSCTPSLRSSCFTLGGKTGSGTPACSTLVMY